MTNKYAVLTQGASERVVIQAESFHVSSDSKTVFFTTANETVAAFPTDKLIGVANLTAISSEPTS